jgi:thiamine biosynthesis lipoprotein ApbE
MKKVIMIVFASMMMLAFTQCGNSNNSNQSETKGSKEYRELCAGLSTCLKAIDKAQDCRELKQAYKDYVDEIYNSDYEFDDMCTDKELEDWEGRVDELERIYDEKADELGCERLLRYGR